MPKPRRKNISREIRDIRFPTSHVPRKPALAESPLRKIRPVVAPDPSPLEERTGSSRRPFPRRPLIVFICAVFFAVIAAGAFWYHDKVTQAFRLRAALVHTLQVGNGTSTPEAGLNALPSFGSLLSLIKDAFSSYNGARQSSWQTLLAVGQTQTVLQDLPARLAQKDGPGLIADLRSLLDTLNSVGDVLQSSPALSDYSGYQPDIERAESVLNALIALLEAPGQHHLLVLFGNSAELRPGGGFLGSFADMAYGSSTIGDVTVHDINEVDRGFTANIVPPQPLQGIVSRWRAADANWFFDYPASARKILEFMAQSSFYAGTASTPAPILDGAILISPQVIQDLLSVTGPVTLADGSTSIAADTVMPMIQREVQAGQASGAAEPKAILAELLPLIEAKLQSLDSAAQDKLLSKAKDWIKNKDVEVFMKDPELAKVAAYYDADGGLYAVPQNFSGDYFAAVNANVGGGKSDAFISDVINIQSDLRSDGVIEDQATIVRADRAAESDEWWYQATNQDYLQVFTPPGTTLSASSGGKARSIAPRTSYAQDFATDPDLAAMESTLKPVPGIPAVSQFRESGKNVFVTWLTTVAGKTGVVKFAYRRARNKPFEDGDTYTFVLERQSGAEQAVDIVLNAPPGFIWQENNALKYEYQNSSVPGRISIDLTLKAL